MSDYPLTQRIVQTANALVQARGWVLQDHNLSWLEFPLLECNQGSTPDVFVPMIEASWSRIVLVEGAEPQRTDEAQFYFIAAVLADEDTPGWLASLSTPEYSSISP